MMLDLETGEYRDLLDARHMYAFIVVDHLGRAYHPLLRRRHRPLRPAVDKLEMLKQTIDGQPPTKESHLADENAHPINWEISPDRKTLYCRRHERQPALQLRPDRRGDASLAGKSLGKLLADRRMRPIAGRCASAPDGTVWAGVEANVREARAIPAPGQLQTGRRRHPGPRAASPSQNPDYTSFTDPDGKPLPWHHGFYKYQDGTLLPRYSILGISAAKDGTMYVLTLAPLTLHAIPFKP